MAFLALAIAILVVGACGESRRSNGEECLRHEDCLSGSCSARTCVPAPPLVSGGDPPTDQEPRIPADAGTTGRRLDAGGGG